MLNPVAFSISFAIREIGNSDNPQIPILIYFFSKKKYHNIIKRLCGADKQGNAANDISYDISMIL